MISEEGPFKEVKYDKPTTSLGRNGIINTIGLSIFKGAEDTDLSPLNSRGDIARCRISIINDNIPEVCVALGFDVIGKILDSLEKTSYVRLMGIDPALDREIAKRMKGD